MAPSTIAAFRKKKPGLAADVGLFADEAMRRCRTGLTFGVSGTDDAYKSTNLLNSMSF